MRELNIIYYDPDTVYVNSYKYHHEDEILAGYEGENETTEMSIYLPSDWSGTFYIGLQDYNGTMTYTSLGTDNEITYYLPAQSKGIVTMVIKAVDGDDIQLTIPIRLKIS